MSVFPRIPIGDLVNSREVELKTGPFGTQLKASEYIEHGIPVINVRNIGFGVIRADKLEYISEATANRLASHLLVEGDIVFGRKGAVERHVYVRPEQSGWFQGSDCLRLRFSSARIDSLFASYFFLTPEHQRWMINQCSHGATMASLNQDILERIALPVPPLNVQRRIVGILSAYDELIENNQRRIRLLESMTRALYREWFVNYRFPGHQKVRRVASKLGEIPEGWCITNLGAISSYINRGLSPSYDKHGASCAINQKCIRDQRLNLDLSRRQTKLVPRDKRVVFGDVLINSTGVGTLGRVAQVYEDLQDCTTDTHVTIVRPSEDVNVDYFGYMLFEKQAEFEKLGVGATGQTELSRMAIGEVCVLLAPAKLQKEFSERVRVMRFAVGVNTKRSGNLRRTRDLLLPRVVAGRLVL